jgi:hypothetical protein
MKQKMKQGRRVKRGTTTDYIDNFYILFRDCFMETLEK